MIKSFKSKGLEKLFTRGDGSKLNQAHLKRIRRILLILNNAKILEDVNIPGLRLHKLKGDLKNKYSLDVSGNFRIHFKFVDGDIEDVDYEDTH